MFGLALAALLAIQDDGVRWVEAFPKGIVVARHVGRPLLLYFTADWCGGCRALEEGALNDERFKRAARRVIAVRIDVDHEPDVAERYGVRFFPSFAIVEPTEGRIVALFRGKRTAEAISQWIDKEAPRYAAWFDSIEAAKASGKVVGVVTPGKGEIAKQFDAALRAEEMLKTWTAVAYVVSNSDSELPSLTLIDPKTDREIARFAAEVPDLPDAILKSLK